MEVVVDSNVLISAMIARSTAMSLFFHPKLRVFAPETLRGEFFRNERDIMSKSGLARGEFDKLVSILFRRIEFAPDAEFSKFLPEARRVLGEHKKDEDFIALCILKGLKLWTHESRLFGIGYGISTKELIEELSKE